MAKRRRRRRSNRLPPGRGVKRCRICLTTTAAPWTKEDVIPIWLRDQAKVWLEALPLTERPDGKLQLEPRILYKPVCDVCNGTLARVFEDRARPLMIGMLDGTVSILTLRDQATLAGWIVKTDILLELSRKQRYGPDGISTDSRFDEPLRIMLLGMMDTGLPPANTTVRITHMTGTTTASPRLLVPPAIVERKAYMVSSVHPIPSASGRGFIVAESVIWGNTSPAPFAEATADDKRFLFLWPPIITQQRWPPLLPFGGNDVTRLRQAWGHHPDNLVGSILDPEVLRANLKILPRSSQEKELPSDPQADATRNAR
jgi:hypothetical protein